MNAGSGYSLWHGIALVVVSAIVFIVALLLMRAAVHRRAVPPSSGGRDMLRQIELQHAREVIEARSKLG